MGKNILQRIDDICQSASANIFYDDQGKTNTYQDLKLYSDSLAAWIDQAGSTAKSPILIFGGQEFQMLAAFVASVKSGHPYIPVDAASSVERLDSIFATAAPELVIEVEDLPSGFSLPENTKVLKKTDLESVFHQKTAYSLTHPVKGDDIFYIIFTSGTTGSPKGVQISHNNLLSFADWVTGPFFDLPKRPVTLAQPPFSFDLSVMDWVTTLLMGGTLKAVSKELSENFKALFELLPKLSLQVFVSTPSFADLCLVDPEFKADIFPELKRFLFCGEELTKKTYQKLQARFPEAKIFNTYGPTEATVAVTGVQITPAIEKEYSRLPIGRAKNDTKIFIVDENGDQVDKGKSGEIVISGPSVSKGYLNNPGKTKQAFFDDQIYKAYHTGDLGRFDDKDQLLYEGRKDFQIKLHGYRIELEEVNQGLNQSHYVKQAIAVPRYDADHKVAQLQAWVVAKENDFSKPIELTKAIKKELTEYMMPYMIPTRFIYKDKLPISLNGKVDIKAVIKEVNNV